MHNKSTADSNKAVEQACVETLEQELKHRLVAKCNEMISKNDSLLN